MPRALVTGCAGFVGSHLTEALLADGHQVRGVDCFNDNYAAGEKLENIGASRSHDGFELHPVDLATADLDRLLEGVDVVFHLAAEPGVRTSWGRRFDRFVFHRAPCPRHCDSAARPAGGRGRQYRGEAGR